jgi:hypothetical protein
LTMVLALLIDRLLVLVGRWLMPWSRTDRRARRRVPLLTAEAAS